MCQVHYNGLIDAIDRTKPVGAVGWAGEAYSYLNSYTGTQIGSGVYPAGLGVASASVSTHTVQRNLPCIVLQ